LSIGLDLAQHLLYGINHATAFDSDNLGAHRLVVSPDIIKRLCGAA
jgi:hypothetical protein